MSNKKIVSPHIKDCDIDHYPDCYDFEYYKCWCHLYDSYGIPCYTDYSDSFYTNDINKQVLCEDCFYLENECVIQI